MSDAVVDPTRAPVDPPLQPWKVWLLCMTTFTLYSMIWLRRAARDLATLDGRPRRLWLWLLAPMFPISLPFCLKALGDDYSRIATLPEGTRHFGALYGWLIFAGGVAVGAIGRFETPGWVTLLLLGTISACFALLQIHINTAKAVLTPTMFRGPAWTFSNAQRWILGLSGLVTLPLLALLVSLDLLRLQGTPLANGTRYTDPAGRFAFTAAGEGWRITSEGAVDDYSSDLEVSGRLAAMHIIVFVYGATSSVDELAAERIGGFELSNPSVRCSEQRRLIAESLAIVAEISCSGRSVVGDPVHDQVRIIADDQALIEVLGHLETVKGSFEQARMDLLNTVASFGPP